MHDLARAIAEAHIVELDARLGDLQRRLVVVVGLGRRAVDDLEQDAHADKSRVELDVEARQPLRRLIGEHEGGEEGEELPRRRAGFDDAEAAIDQRAGDGKSAQRFHQRACPVRHPRPFVRLVLQLGDVGVEPPPHHVFEREGLHGADALHRLLHGFEDARAAEELVPGNAVDAADHLAQHDERRRRHDEAEKRHDRVLIDHHREQADQRKQIAADRGDDQVDDLARGGGSGGQPRHELGGMPLREERDVLVDQGVEHLPLIQRNDAVADPRQHHRRAVGGRAP